MALQHGRLCGREDAPFADCHGYSKETKILLFVVFFTFRSLHSNKNQIIEKIFTFLQHFPTYKQCINYVTK